MAIWIPEFDAYFLNRLKQIKIEDKPVFATYAVPETEGAEDSRLTLPGITFYMYDTLHDIEREQSTTLNVTSQTDSHKTLQKIPTPVKLCYQFTIMANYMEHHNEMISQFLRLFPYRGAILVSDPVTKDLVDFDFFWKAQSVRNSTHNPPFAVGQGERLFRTEFRYHLPCEHDVNPEETHQIVTGGVESSLTNADQIRGEGND
jgi:hypothetical protein